MSPTKIFIIFPSTSGHFNPVCGLVSELCKQHSDIECVFYGNEENREAIENIGAQFRLYSHRNLADLAPTKVTDKQPILHTFMNAMYECSYALLPDLTRDARRDRPSLIIYDACFFPARFLLEILKKEGQEVKSVMFYPNFVFDNDMLLEMPGMKRSRLKYIIFFY